MAGLAAVAVALAPPLHGVAEVLLSAHMLQHLLLVGVAAPLLALARPARAFSRLPFRPRSGPGRALMRLGVARLARRSTPLALTAWSLHVGALWLWHVPGLYAAAQVHPWLHGLAHVSLLGTAWLFWTQVLPPRARPGLGPLGGVLCLFAAAGQGVALGALIALADQPWYPWHEAPTRALGQVPLDDQRLAGLLMWIPGGLPYVFAALWIAGARLSAAGGALILAVVLAAAGCVDSPAPPELTVALGDAARGRAAITRYGCTGCHDVPGIRAVRGRAGPSLAGLARRRFLAGHLANDPPTLVAWIRDPRALDPRTAMPALGVTEGDARDIAAYLYRAGGD